MKVITRGDDEPDLVLSLTDTSADVDFSTVMPSAVTIMGELDGTVVVNGPVDSIEASADGKTAILRRAWGPGETDTAGIMWFTVQVEWASGRTQTFPRDRAIPLHIRRAAGDA